MWYNWLSLVITLGCYGFSLFVFVASVIKNSRDDGCTEGIMAASVNLLLAFVTSGLSVSSLVREADNGPGPTNGVFQSSIVAAYANYQV